MKRLEQIRDHLVEALGLPPETIEAYFERLQTSRRARQTACGEVLFEARYHGFIEIYELTREKVFYVGIVLEDWFRDHEHAVEAETWSMSGEADSDQLTDIVLELELVEAVHLSEAEEGAIVRSGKRYRLTPLPEERGI